VQILTVAEILAGKRPLMPAPQSPFAHAPLEREKATQLKMPGEQLTMDNVATSTLGTRTTFS